MKIRNKNRITSNEIFIHFEGGRLELLCNRPVYKEFHIKLAQ